MAKERRKIRVSNTDSQRAIKEGEAKGWKLIDSQKDSEDVLLLFEQQKTNRSCLAVVLLSIFSLTSCCVCFLVLAVVTDSNTTTSKEVIQSRYISSSGSNVNLRSGPGTNYNKFGSIAHGTRINITDEERNASGELWYEIQYNGETAWVSASFTSASRPAAASSNSGGSSDNVRPTSNPVQQQQPPGVSCGGATVCGEMQSCEQAYACLREGNTRLDRDKDGIPCDNMCQGG